MEHSTAMKIRIALGAIGIIIILIAIFNLYTNISTAVQSLIGSQALDFNQLISNIIKILIIGLVGFIVYFAGRHWSNSLKAIMSVAIFLSILFMLFAIILQPFHSNAGDFANALQETFDFTLANAADKLLEDQVEILEGETLPIILVGEVTNTKLHTSNLTSTQADIILDLYSIDESDEEDKMFLAKYLISETYNQLFSVSPSLIETPIPDSVVKDQIDSLGIDIGESIDLFKSDIFQSIAEINEDAYLIIAISEKDPETRLVTIGSLTDKDTNDIWKELGFPDEISTDGKKKSLDIMLSVFLDFTRQSPIGDIQIPLSTLSSQIPQEMQALLGYDLLTSDQQIRTQEIARLRDDCIADVITIEEVCEQIELTDYNTLMTNIEQILAEQNMQLPEPILDLIEEVNTIEKVESLIKEKTKSWKKFLFWGILMFVVAIASYFAHYKVFKREYESIEILYTVSKINIFQLLPVFILVLLIYIVISGKLLVKIISGFIPSESAEIVGDSVANSPLIVVLKQTVGEIFFSMVIYTSIALLLFIILLVLMIKFVPKKEEEQPQKEVKQVTKPEQKQPQSEEKTEQKEQPKPEQKTEKQENQEKAEE